MKRLSLDTWIRIFILVACVANLALLVLNNRLRQGWSTLTSEARTTLDDLNEAKDNWRSSAFVTGVTCPLRNNFEFFFFFI